MFDLWCELAVLSFCSVGTGGGTSTAFSVKQTGAAFVTLALASADVLTITSPPSMAGTSLKITVSVCVLRYGVVCDVLILRRLLLGWFVEHGV
jgi:hypothetical protein